MFNTSRARTCAGVKRSAGISLRNLWVRGDLLQRILDCFKTSWVQPFTLFIIFLKGHNYLAIPINTALHPFPFPPGAFCALGARPLALSAEQTWLVVPLLQQWRPVWPGIKCVLCPVQDKDWFNRALYSLNVEIRHCFLSCKYWGTRARLWH